MLLEEDYLFSKCPSLFQWDCKSSSVCLPEINVSGRIFKTMERHKCWLSAGCTNSKLLKLLRSCFWAVNCPFFISHEHKRSQDLWLFVGYHLPLPNQVGIYLPCYDIFRNWLEEFSIKNAPSTTPYMPLIAGALARSLACATCYPIELARTRMQVTKKMLITTLGLLFNVNLCPNFHFWKSSHTYVRLIGLFLFPFLLHNRHLKWLIVVQNLLVSGKPYSRFSLMSRLQAMVKTTVSQFSL